MANKGRIKYHTFTKSWGCNQFCRDMAIQIDNYIDQFSDCEKKVILELIKNFNYYGERKRKLAQKLFEEFNTNYYMESKSAHYYSFVKKDGKMHHSTAFFSNFCEVNNLFRVSGTEPEFKKKQKIWVFVDDYVGTGKTFIDYFDNYLKYNLNILKQKSIFLLVLNISELGQNNILQEFNDKSIKINIISLDVSKKAFDNNFIYKEKNCLNKKEIYQNCCERYKINQDYIFGYKDTEALVAMDYNTPNNTLGLFWCESENVNWLFKRDNQSEITPNTMQKQEKNRKEIKDKVFIRKRLDKRKKYLIVYCIVKKRKFTVEDACKDLGYTQEELIKYLGDLIFDNCIVKVNDRYQASEEIKNYLIKNRLKEYRKIIDNIKNNKCSNKVDMTIKDNYVPKEFEKKFNGYK